MTVELTTLSATIYLKSSDGGILVLVGTPNLAGKFETRRLDSTSSFLAVHAELRCATGCHGAPVSLIFSVAVDADAGRLGRLVECFEVEDVKAPIQHATDALRPERSGVGGACNRGLVVGTTCEVIC